MNRSRPPQAVAWAAAALCGSLLSQAPAIAQPAAAMPPADGAAASAPQALPEVRITGTTLRRIGAETALPVIVLHRADIERSNARTATELLQQLPVMQGAISTSTVAGVDSRGYADLDIHDLGGQYTLVLLNGQRIAPFGGQQINGALPSVDINTIPLAMIERIEVLTDGASAIYGSDALGGVVNVITRRDGDADEATAGLSFPRGGAREWRASAFKSIGHIDQGGQNLSLSASVMRRTALVASERSYAREANVDFVSGGQRYRLAGAFPYSAPGNLFGQTGPESANAYLVANGHCPRGQYSDGILCDYNYAADVDLIPAQDQHSVMASYTRRIADEGQLQMDALWSRSQVRSHLAPAPADVYVRSTSPWYAAYVGPLGFSDDPIDVGYRFTDLGRRSEQDTSTLGHLALRLEGRTQGWRWQTGWYYSLSTLRSDIANTLGQYTALFLTDAEPAFNPFAAAGEQSPEGLAAERRHAYQGIWTAGRSTLSEWQIQGSRPIASLPGGDLQWSIGGNIRHERLSTQPSLFAQGLLLDPGAGTLAPDGNGDIRIGDAVPIVPSTASRTSWGVFSEMLAPLAPGFQLGAAVREDHDDLTAHALTGKLNARWQASPTLLFRASAGTGFKNPPLNTIRSPQQSVGLQAQTCTEALQTLATQFGATPCTLGDSNNSVPLIYAGNPDLKPEHSIQSSVGFKVQPERGLTLGMDLWAVHIQDRIGEIDPSLPFADPLAFIGMWTTVPGLDGTSTQLALLNQSVNIGTLMSSGIDAQATLRRSTAWGLIDSRLNGTVILREDSQSYPGGPWVSAIGDGQNTGPTLKWRAAWRTSLILQGWTHTLTARYQSGYEDQATQVQPLDGSGQPVGDKVFLRVRVPGQLLWDWLTTWQATASCQWSAGVTNLFDTKPAFSISNDSYHQGQMVGYDNRYFEPRGRTIIVEARLSF